MLAAYWIAYYWPFVDPATPIWQGPRAQRTGQRNNDVSFRPALTALRQHWAMLVGTVRSADGFVLIDEMRVARRRATFPQSLTHGYEHALDAMVVALHQPMQYAGPPGHAWTVFGKPRRYQQVADTVVAVPASQPSDLCLVLSADLWNTFQEVSVWVEALCIHEWCLFTERVAQAGEHTVGRGAVYELLTDRPDNRRPLTWERNSIDVLLLEGNVFVCPWTERRIARGVPYDVDHLVPVALYPINELWNLVPADRNYNQHVKRDRLASAERLLRAQPHLATTYAHYTASHILGHVLREDVAVRFTGVQHAHAPFPQALAHAVSYYINHVATVRNSARF